MASDGGSAGKTGADVKGLVIGGRFGELVARQGDDPFEIGELLIAEPGDGQAEPKVLCQVYDLLTGSQISQQQWELLGGMALQGTRVELLDPELRQYTLALLKELLTVHDGKTAVAKAMPSFFAGLRTVRTEDFGFLVQPRNPLYLGQLRSGGKALDVPVHLDARDILSHHVLVPATTGRGKSNLLKCVLWSVIEQPHCGMLVLDPHDEYYRPKNSLSAHPRKEKIRYYSPNPLPGTDTLAINLRQLRPQHFDGVLDWSGPQKEALGAFFKVYGEEWLEAIAIDEPLPDHYRYNEATLGVLRRRVLQTLDLSWDGQQLFDDGIFKLNAGKSTINDVVDALERGQTVVVDTSGFGGAVEILVGSIFASEVLTRYRRYKRQGVLDAKPVISVVLEEAPRVLGKEVLEAGPNVFSTIAREGRKFQVGLFAITQLPSLIPRQVLANMNTKIVLGLEMKPERQAIIDSASQDLSQDDRAIASLDKGEAIVTTNFSPFAIPIKIPFFDDVVAASRRQVSHDSALPATKSFPGLKK